MISIKDSSVLGALGAADVAVADGMVRTYRAAGAHNPTGASVTLVVHLVPKNGAADATNRIISRAVPSGKTDLCPELIGRGLNTGGTLWAGGAGLTFGATSIDTIVG